MAEELGLSRDTVSHFFNGHPIDKTIFLEIASILGIDAETIIDDEINIEEKPGHADKNKSASPTECGFSPICNSQDSESFKSLSAIEAFYSICFERAIQLISNQLRCNTDTLRTKMIDDVKYLIVIKDIADIFFDVRADCRGKSTELNSYTSEEVD